MFYSRIVMSMAVVALTSPGLMVDAPAHAAESSDPPTAQ